MPRRARPGTLPVRRLVNRACDGSAPRRVPLGDMGLFDRETWLFINSFAPWLAALGTVAAVIVALYLARRASRLDIRVFGQNHRLRQSEDGTEERILPDLCDKSRSESGCEHDCVVVSWLRSSKADLGCDATKRSLIHDAPLRARLRQGSVFLLPDRDVQREREVSARTRQGFKIPAAYCSSPACWRGYEY